MLQSNASSYSLDREGVAFCTPVAAADDLSPNLMLDDACFSSGGTLHSADMFADYQTLFETNNQTIHRFAGYITDSPPQNTD